MIIERVIAGDGQFPPASGVVVPDAHAAAGKILKAVSIYIQGKGWELAINGCCVVEHPLADVVHLLKNAIPGREGTVQAGCAASQGIHTHYGVGRCEGRACNVTGGFGAPTFNPWAWLQLLRGQYVKRKTPT